MKTRHVENYLRDIGSHLERAEQLLRAYIFYLKQQEKFTR